MIKVCIILISMVIGIFYHVDYLGSGEQVSTASQRYSFDIYCGSGECTSAAPGCRGTLDYVIECINEEWSEEAE